MTKTEKKYNYLQNFNDLRKISKKLDLGFIELGYKDIDQDERIYYVSNNNNNNNNIWGIYKDKDFENFKILKKSFFIDCNDSKVSNLLLKTLKIDNSATSLIYKKNKNEFEFFLKKRNNYLRYGEDFIYFKFNDNINGNQHISSLINKFMNKVSYSCLSVDYEVDMYIKNLFIELLGIDSINIDINNYEKRIYLTYCHGINKEKIDRLNDLQLEEVFKHHIEGVFNKS